MSALRVLNKEIRDELPGYFAQNDVRIVHTLASNKLLVTCVTQAQLRNRTKCSKMDPNYVCTVSKSAALIVVLLLLSQNKNSLSLS